MSTFCGIFFFRGVGKKKHPHNTVEILRLFSVKKIGLVCVWFLGILNKNPDNIRNFAIIFFYNWKSTLPTILSNICTNFSGLSDEI